MIEPPTMNRTGENPSRAGADLGDTGGAPAHATLRCNLDGLMSDVSSADQAARALLFACQAHHRLEDRLGPSNPERGVGLPALEFLAIELTDAAERILGHVGDVLDYVRKAEADAAPCPGSETESASDDRD